MSQPGKKSSNGVPEVPITEWGRDHWSTLAYAETCVVDRANALGQPLTGKLDLDKLRRNPARHAEWIGKVHRMRGMTSDWHPNYGTRLKGFHKDKSRRIDDHDDWDCLFDMQRENLLTVVDPRKGIIRFTPRGVALAARVREAKANGRSFSDFESIFNRSMLLAHEQEPAKPGELTAADIKKGRCYEAKRMNFVGPENLANDRQIIFVNASKTEVQYDSPTVKDGMQYPAMPMEKFLQWARRDVTDLMPKGDWRSYAYVKGKK